MRENGRGTRDWKRRACCLSTDRPADVSFLCVCAALFVACQVSVSQDTYAEAVRSKRFRFEWNRDVELFEEEWGVELGV